MSSKIFLPKNLGQGTPVKEIPNEKYYEPGHHASYFPVGLFFIRKYNCFPCIINVNKTYSEGLINFLRENAELLHDIATVKNTPQPTTERVSFSSEAAFMDSVFGDDNDDTELDYKGAFLYKDCVITFHRAPSKKTKTQGPPLFSFSIYYRPNTTPPLQDFDSFLIEEDIKNVIHTIFRDEHGGIIFEPFEVTVPDSYSIDELYIPEFREVHENIVENLKKNESGLFLFHGEPGTGKTTYIKHLSSQVRRDMIYVPVAFIDSIVDPSFLPSLLRKRHCVLVIEDAEKALLARDPGDASSFVSTILNITDGIMGNVFNIAIIATYNSPRQDIDKALLRKGRLKGEFKFDKLPVQQCQNILDKNNIKYTATEPMTLAEIFNVEAPDVLFSQELKTEKRMGFGFSQ
jgi:hypothetical protein